MDALEFIASIVASVAWPLAAVAALFMIRKPLAALATVLRRLKYGDVEISFEKEFKELEASRAAALPPGPQAAPVLTEQLARLAEISPSAVIIETWHQVAKAAVVALVQHNLPLPPDHVKNPTAVEEALRAAGILNGPQVDLLRRLRTIYGYAARDSDFLAAPGMALDYAATARDLIEVLNAGQRAV